MNHALVDMPVWNWAVVMLEGGTPDEVETYGRSCGLCMDEGVSPHCSGHCWVQAGVPILVWVHKRSDVPVLVHELMHAVFGMLEARGLSHCDKSEEAYTYTLGYLLTAALKRASWRKVRA